MSNPHFLMYLASYDVASNISQPGSIARHVLQRILNPRVLSSMAYYDVASNICQALLSNAFEPSSIEFNGIL